MGAQVGYRDLAGFGPALHRLRAAPSSTADVLYQLGALDGIARASGTRVTYVKPHGALYNTAVHDEEQAAAVVDAVAAYDARPPGPRPAGVRVAGRGRAGRAGHRCARRSPTAATRPTGTLVPRSQEGALLTDPAEVADRVLRLVADGTVVAVDGSVVAIEAESVCVHGDSPGAVAMVRAVRARLEGPGSPCGPSRERGAHPAAVRRPRGRWSSSAAPRARWPGPTRWRPNRPAGVADVVPAAETVLVVLAEDAVPGAGARGAPLDPCGRHRAAASSRVRSRSRSCTTARTSPTSRP